VDIVTNHTQLMDMIRRDESSRRTAIRELVQDQKLKGKVIAYIKNNNGDQTDGETMFHDAIVTFVKTIFTKRDYEISTHIHGYILGVARNLWMNELRKKAKHKSDPIEYAEHTPSESDHLCLIMKGERSKILKAVLNQMAKNCKDVLLLWSAGYKMTEIAQKLNYKTEGVARKKKSNCMKELYTYLGNNPHIVERIRPV
jgi:RNA polymerase sigma factor (sigma-70 family)